MYVCMYVYVCVYIYIYIYIYKTHQELRGRASDPDELLWHIREIWHSGGSMLMLGSWL